MQFYIRLCFIVVVQNVAILGEKDVERFWISGRQMGREGFMWNYATLAPSAIRDLRGRGQLRRSSSTLRTWLFDRTARFPERKKEV
jgi:hypothetical protein